MSGISLLDVVRSIDPDATSMPTSGSAEWVRSALGILGIVKLEDCGDPHSLRATVSERISSAYAELESASASPLQEDEFWNILLFLRAPLARHQALANPDMARALAEVAQDTRGSRKVILWKGESPLLHLAPLGGAAVGPSAADPIRDALTATAETPDEQRLVQVFLKRRLTEDDIDLALRTLARKEQGK